MITWPYIAGFFDGEGNINLPLYGRGSGSPRIAIDQTRERGRVLLEGIRSFLDANGIPLSAVYVCRRKVPEKHAEHWTLRIQQRESSIAFLEAVLPYLHIKKTEAQDIVRFSRLYPRLSGRLNAMLTWESIRRNGTRRHRRRKPQ